MRYRILYLVISLSFLLSGLYGVLKWGFVLGVDFKGGAAIEYRAENSFSTEESLSRLDREDIKVNSIKETGEGTYIFRISEVDNQSREKIVDILNELSGGDVVELRFESVGPAIGPELIRKTFYAIAIASGSILLWIAYQFRSLKFGTSAILAMFHDTFILIGLFSLFGHFYYAELDFLFVTAVLTTLSFSVHDTIVVFDRIREIRKKNGGTISEIADRAISETMRRSINNSLTIIFVLTTLSIFGGSTIHWFAVALLIGTILGTYSSPFVAVPILVTWEELARRVKNSR